MSAPSAEPGPAPLADAEVVVVVPSWNAKRHLVGLLPTLREQDQGDLAVLVVDNGSSDGTSEELATNWPEVATLSLPENVGFAAGVNRGVATSRGEYVALVNADVELDPSWAKTLVRALRETPNAASAAGKLLDATERDVLDGAGDVVGWDGYCVRRGHGELDNGQYDRRSLVVSACAGAALYRRSALDSVGRFDERFFCCTEDTDWGLRAQLLGYDCVYEPSAVAYHLVGGTIGGLDGFELYYFHRNSIKLMIKNFPTTALLLHAPLAMGRRIASLAKAVHAGHGGTILRAWSAALRELPSSIRARRSIQSRRSRGYRELARMVPHITPFP